MSSAAQLYDDIGVRSHVEFARPPVAHAVPDAALTRALRLFVDGRLGGHADSEDLVQETYLRLFKVQAAARVDNVKAFCFAVARNLVLDHHRIHRGRTSVELDETLVCPHPVADVVLAYRRAVAILATALERMPSLRREIFLRKRLDGSATTMIASDLEMSVAAVEKHVTRAAADLRAALARRGFTMDGGA